MLDNQYLFASVLLVAAGSRSRLPPAEVPLPPAETLQMFIIAPSMPGFRKRARQNRLALFRTRPEPDRALFETLCEVAVRQVAVKYNSFAAINRIGLNRFAVVREFGPASSRRQRIFGVPVLLIFLAKMEWLHVQRSHLVKEPIHDTASSTHARGHADP
jgi:hypothetical protein